MIKEESSGDSIVYAPHDIRAFPFIFIPKNTAINVDEVISTVRQGLYKLTGKTHGKDPVIGAIQILRELQVRKAVSTLLIALEDNNKAVRREALESLEQLGIEPPKDLLQEKEKLDREWEESSKIEEQQEAKKGCFIATAVYGSPLSEQVVILTMFRDNVLSKTLLGNIFIRIYYFFSPAIARIITKSEILKEIVRTILISPLVEKVELILKKGDRK